MPTVINNPSSDSGNGLGAGLILGIIVTVLIIVILFFVYGWPALQNTRPQEGTNINVQIPDLNPGDQNQGDQPQGSGQ